MAGHEDTIYATSTKGLPAALAIVRVSGPKTRFVFETMIGRCPKPRYAEYVTIRDPRDESPIDRGLVLWFPGPNSFTGEDSGEFHIHGSKSVVGVLLASLSGLSDLRMADPGEFTYRAFLNGKMDLTSVEGLADLIAAETETQRRQALRQGDGRLGEQYGIWRNRIVHARAMIEAELDFSDEEDVPDSASVGIWSDLEALSDDIRAHCQQSSKSRAIRSGLSVVLQGRPNAGKSSLLNALSKRDAVIVSEEPGTTRDVVTIDMNLGGYLFSISDTAGIRETDSSIESEGVRRAVDAGRKADLVLWLMDGVGLAVPGDPAKVETDAPIWFVMSKSDLIDSVAERSVVHTDLMVSAMTGDGLPDLESKLVSFAEEYCGTGMENLSTRARHIEELQGTVTGLNAAISGDGKPLEMRAEDLRTASDCLGRLTGKIDVEDLFDVIFSEFCVGK